MATAVKLDATRRGFLAASLAIAGELAIGISLIDTRANAAAPTPDGVFQPDAWIRINRQGEVTVVVPFAEMGQGTMTASAMLIAEELEVDPALIRTEHAPGDNLLYRHPLLGEQITGGSTSVSGSWKPMRQGAAAARMMLIEAAARNWRVAPASCTAEAGQVLHRESGRSAPYGTLVDSASALPVPKDPPIKTGNFRVLGKPLRRNDTPAKVDGTALFGMDVRLPGMRYAAVQTCPIIGGELKALDDAPALAVRGVSKVVRLPDAIAVIAAHSAAARKGLAALSPQWGGGLGTLSTETIVAQCDAALGQTGTVATSKGDVAKSFAGAGATFEAVYRMPMLAHAAMEPLNCTLHVRSDGCEVWVGSQVPGRARIEVAQALGFPVEKVRVNNHLIGGGFGRRLQSEWIVQAALIARQADGPLKVVWSREEDMRQDCYRYHNHSRVKVALDAKGVPVAWDHRIVGPAIMAWFLPKILFKDGVDLDVTGSAYGPYVFPNVHVDFVRNDPPKGLLAGNWRGVGETRNCFVVETAIDELAALARQDPAAYRRQLLPSNSRIAAVLDRVTTAAQWGKTMPAGGGQGLAILTGFGSHIGLVTEVQVGKDDHVHVTRMTCVIDCGHAVNPNIVKQQIEGGIIYGLSAVFYGRITLKEGQIEQSNFTDYPVVRMNEAPPIEVILIESTEDPGGVGEPGTAITAPAVLNAIYAATGRRLRSLPLDHGKVGRA